MAHQVPQQAPMPQLQVPLPPMPQLPGPHVPGIPLRGSLSMTLPGVEEIAGIADDDQSRSLGLQSIEMSCSLPQNGVGSLLDLNDMRLGEGTRTISTSLPEVETALSAVEPPLATSP